MGSPRYVTDAFDANPVGLDAAQVALSGAPIMIREVVRLLLTLGVEQDQLHLNVGVATFDPTPNL